MPVAGGGDAQRMAFGDRLAEQLEQRAVNARVLDAGGREKEFHEALSESWPTGQSEERRSGAPGIDRVLQILSTVRFTVP